jgi:hypothetical protein
VSYDKFRNVGNAEPTDFGSAFFKQAGVILQTAFEYKAPWGFTDIDALTEKHGIPLLIERKDGGADIFQKGLTAQKKAIEGITRRVPGAMGFVVWADVGLYDIRAFRVCIDGVWGDVDYHDCAPKMLKLIEQWGQLVMAIGPLEKWDTKWYPRKGK